MKFRILLLRIDGKDWYFPQRRVWLIWRDIKTEYDNLYCQDGRVQTLYTAECRIKDYIKARTNNPIIITVVEE